MKSENRNILIRVLCALCCLHLSAFTSGARGQQNPATIRVESRDVVVPVLVLDNEKVDDVQRLNYSDYMTSALQKGNPVVSRVAVSDLLAKDFQILEDGHAQDIASVTTAHYDITLEDRSLGAGQGRWVAPDLEELHLYPPEWSFYLIRYSRPPSAPGSCHQISVKVDRPNSLVYSREEYCNSSQPDADPLNGTRLGNELFADLTSTGKGRIRLDISAFESFRATNDAAAHVVIGFPTMPRKPYHCDKPPDTWVSILGVVYKTDGTLVARFSDILPVTRGSFLGLALPPLIPPAWPCISAEGPYQYQIQLGLPSGNYKIKAVFSNGKQFGCAETSLTVTDHDENQLAISDVTLARNFHEVKTETDSQDDPFADAAAPPGSYAPLVTKGIDVIPTADTVFHGSEPFYFYFEIYQPIKFAAAAGVVRAQVRIVDTRTNEVIRNLQPVDAASYGKPGDHVIPVGGGVDISALPAGRYQLEAQATSSSGNATPWRSASFTIVR